MSSSENQIAPADLDFLDWIDDEVDVASAAYALDDHGVDLADVLWLIHEEYLELFMHETLKTLFIRTTEKARDALDAFDDKVEDDNLEPIDPLVALAAERIAIAMAGGEGRESREIAKRALALGRRRKR